MNSELTKEFIDLFKKLPPNIQNIAKHNYKLWKDNPNHPSLAFKKIHRRKLIYSIRVGIGWRAIGIMKDRKTIVWFWIGSHNDYDRLIKKLKI